MWGKALELASRITHPWTIAVFVSVIAAAVFVFALRAKRSRLPRAVWIVLAVGIIILGLAPLVASTLLQSRGIYRIHIVLLRPDQSLADIAQVRSSTGGELKMVDGGWELDVSPQTRPADGKVTVFASVKDEFLSGKSMLILAQDYYPTATIQLTDDTSAVVRGVVVDENLGAIAGATVSVEGYPDVAVTDRMGNFVLPAQAGKGQMVEVRAQKGQLSGRLSVPAGKTVEIVISRRPH